MKTNQRKADKERLELIRTTKKCEHGHIYETHPACFKRDHVRKEKIAFLDIEAEDLSADYGIMFCWCLRHRGKTHYDTITEKDIKKGRSKKRNKEPQEDARVLKTLLEKIEELKIDRLIGHYSSRYDLPFILTRSVICGVEYPQWGRKWQTDTWEILRKRFKLSRNSLENGARKLTGKSRKDKLSLSIKHGVLRGEKWAIDDCLNHCKKDVLDTEDLYEKIYPYANEMRKSI